MQAEGLTRSIGNFGRFLDVAGLTNGEQVNFAKVASDTGLAPSTVREHYRILEDTLVGDQLPAFRGTRTRKPVATAKFYFFDVGVANTLRRTGVIEPGSDAYGRALEHLVFLEVRSWLDYRRRDDLLTYWRSRSQLEVDLVIGDAVAIEVKGKSRSRFATTRACSPLPRRSRLSGSWWCATSRAAGWMTTGSRSCRCRRSCGSCGTTPLSSDCSTREVTSGRAASLTSRLASQRPAGRARATSSGSRRRRSQSI